MRLPFVKTLWKASMLWSEDRASYLGAALAYHALFSIAPLLIIAIASIGIFYGEDAMKVRVIELAKQQIGQEGAQALNEMLEHVWRPTTTIWASIVGPIILFFTASNFFLQLGTALEMIWNIKPTANRHWLYGMVKNYVMAFLMVVISGTFLIALMIADGMITYFINLMRQYEIGNPSAWGIGYYLLSILLVAVLFLFTFRVLSHGKIPFALLWEGALVASILFLFGRLFFTWYVASMGKSMTTAFGAASSIVIFLIWVYYSAQIMFFGAEVVKVRLQARRGNGGNGVSMGALS